MCKPWTASSSVPTRDAPLCSSDVCLRCVIQLYWPFCIPFCCFLVYCRCLPFFFWFSFILTPPLLLSLTFIIEGALIDCLFGFIVPVFLYPYAYYQSNRPCFALCPVKLLFDVLLGSFPLVLCSWVMWWLRSLIEHRSLLMILIFIFHQSLLFSQFFFFLSFLLND
jgi:hypothetical protein